MADDQSKLAISPVKTGIWFAFAAVPFLLVASFPLMIVCCGHTSAAPGVVDSIEALVLYGVPPMLFSGFVGAYVGRIFLQQQNKLIGLLCGPVVAVLTGVILGVCIRIFESYSTMQYNGPGVAIAVGQMIFVCIFLVYAICALVIGILLTFCKKLIVEKSTVQD